MAELIDGIAVVLSGAALWITVREVQRDSKERRLAATPHLTFTRWASEGTGTLTISLASNGLGPAQIAAFSYMLDGRPIQGLAYGDWDKTLSKLGIKARIKRAAFLDVGMLLPPGFEITLLEIAEIKDASGKGCLVRDAVKRLSVGIQFRSIYGDLLPTIDADDRFE